MSDDIRDYGFDYMSHSNKKRKMIDDNDSDCDNNKKSVNYIEAEDIHIYSVGNEIHFSSSITTESIQKVIKEMQKLIHNHFKKSPNTEMTLSYTVDSPGGSVLSIFKFVDFIAAAKRKYPKLKFVSVITGLAASAGTIMALVADERMMTANAYAMIHELASGNSGKYTFLSSHMTFLVQLHDRLAKFYVDVTGKTKDEIEVLMKNETWFSAEQYKELGLVSKIV